MATRSIRKLIGLDGVFSVVFFIGIVGVALSMLHWFCLKPSDGATLFAGLTAAAMGGGQGHLIKGQMQLQAIIELHKEWNSSDMLVKRKLAWSDKNEVNED